MYSGITLTLTSDTILSGSDTNISGSVVDIAANSLYDGGNELTINRNITSMQLDNVFDQTPLTIYGTGTIDVNEFTYGTSNRLMIDELNSTNADTILQLTTDVENYLLEGLIEGNEFSRFYVQVHGPSDLTIPLKDPPSNNIVGYSYMQTQKQFLHNKSWEDFAQFTGIHGLGVLPATYNTVTLSGQAEVIWNDDYGIGFTITSGDTPMSIYDLPVNPTPPQDWGDWTTQNFQMTRFDGEIQRTIYDSTGGGPITYGDDGAQGFETFSVVGDSSSGEPFTELFPLVIPYDGAGGVFKVTTEHLNMPDNPSVTGEYGNNAPVGDLPENPSWEEPTQFVDNNGNTWQYAWLTNGAAGYDVPEGEEWNLTTPPVFGWMWVTGTTPPGTYPSAGPWDPEYFTDSGGNLWGYQWLTNGQYYGGGVNPNNMTTPPMYGWVWISGPGAEIVRRAWFSPFADSDNNSENNSWWDYVLGSTYHIEIPIPTSIQNAFQLESPQIFDGVVNEWPVQPPDTTNPYWFELELTTEQLSTWESPFNGFGDSENITQVGYRISDYSPATYSIGYTQDIITETVESVERLDLTYYSENIVSTSFHEVFDEDIQFNFTTTKPEVQQVLDYYDIVRQPWQGRDYLFSTTNPNITTPVIYDNRFPLGTYIENNRDFWEKQTFDEITYTSQMSDENLQLADSLITSSEAYPSVYGDDVDFIIPSVQSFSVDALAFKVKDDKSYPLCFYYDKDLQREEYEATTEGKVSLKLVKREPGRPTNTYFNPHIDRPVFDSDPQSDGENPYYPPTELFNVGAKDTTSDPRIIGQPVWAASSLSPTDALPYIYRTDLWSGAEGRLYYAWLATDPEEYTNDEELLYHWKFIGEGWLVPTAYEVMSDPTQNVSGNVGVENADSIPLTGHGAIFPHNSTAKVTVSFSGRQQYEVFDRLYVNGGSYNNINISVSSMFSDEWVDEHKWNVHPQVMLSIDWQDHVHDSTDPTIEIPITQNNWVETAAYSRFKIFNITGDTTFIGHWLYMGGDDYDQEEEGAALTVDYTANPPGWGFPSGPDYVGSVDDTDELGEPVTSWTFNVFGSPQPGGDFQLNQWVVGSGTTAQNVNFPNGNTSTDVVVEANSTGHINLVANYVEVEPTVYFNINVTCDGQWITDPDPDEWWDYGYYSVIYEGSTYHPGLITFPPSQYHINFDGVAEGNSLTLSTTPRRVLGSDPIEWYNFMGWNVVSGAGNFDDSLFESNMQTTIIQNVTGDVTFKAMYGLQ